MTFQKTVRFDQAAGIVGELAYDGPSRVTPGLVADDNAANSYVGRFYTLNPTTGKYSPGGSIGTGDDDPVFGGISIMPKEYVSFGNSQDGPLGPTLALPQSQPVSFCEMGFVWLYASGAVQQGDQVAYNTNTGVISVVSRTGELPANTALIPNTVVHRVPNLPATDGSMYVAKLTN